MLRITDPAAVQAHALAARAEGRRLVVVPTMGALHDGHLSLVRLAHEHGDHVVLTLFVNPTQFAPTEDLSRYPRPFERDAELAQSAGVAVLFHPSPEAMYPAGFSTTVQVGGVTSRWEGASRPEHFSGVATVVTKLLTITQPHVAVFGEKDYQQLATIRRLTADLNLPVEIVGAPLVREADGLALSSRNVYLSPDERAQALSLNQALTAAQSAGAVGERNGTRLVREMTARIAACPLAEIDYIAVVDGRTLEPVETVQPETRALLAVRFGRTRLIDNARLR